MNDRELILAQYRCKFCVRKSVNDSSIYSALGGVVFLLMCRLNALAQNPGGCFSCSTKHLGPSGGLKTNNVPFILTYGSVSTTLLCLGAYAPKAYVVVLSSDWYGAP